jgi:aconitate decarboxylase
MGKVDYTLRLAAFLANLRYEDLPPNVVDQARKSILNAIGCGLGYSHHSSAGKAFSMMKNGKPSAEATIIGRQQRASLDNAVLINGIALTTADYDDTHLKTVIHPSGTPIAALLSWSEVNQLSGRDFILAFVCGVEAQCAVGNAVSPGHYRDGW